MRCLLLGEKKKEKIIYARNVEQHQRSAALNVENKYRKDED